VKLVVISPEEEDPREVAVLGALLRAGLERYHVRKPAWGSERLGAWLEALPAAWRPRLVLHSHYHWVGALGLGGRHWRDEAGAPTAPGEGYTSRSCHDLAGLTAALGAYTAVFFGPVFPSLSKPDHGPVQAETAAAVAQTLADRSAVQRQTAVIALGGVTLERLAHCRDLGYDGAAVLGAVWQSAQPVSAFQALQAAAAAIPALVLI
jgi:thiamine-phosphate pyrophosphorylase